MGKGLDCLEWRISNDGRRRRLTVEEILNQASGVAAINDVGSDDGIAGRLGPVQGSSRTWLRSKSSTSNSRIETQVGST